MVKVKNCGCNFVIEKVKTITVITSTCQRSAFFIKKRNNLRCDFFHKNSFYQYLGQSTTDDGPVGQGR